jgi:hypothetical protein
MNVDCFQKLLKPVTDFVSNQAMDPALAEKLNRQFPYNGEIFNAIEAACHKAISDGWMCEHGTVGRRFGRVIESTEETGWLSVDVVDLENMVGPHHRHPTGEICMIMPVTKSARFDGTARGWCVFQPGSDHRPTVTDGEALILYMLPEGKIEFTEQ